jgi:hypothetical protein
MQRERKSISGVSQGPELTPTKSDAHTQQKRPSLNTTVTIVKLFDIFSANFSRRSGESFTFLMRKFVF